MSDFERYADLDGALIHSVRGKLSTALTVAEWLSVAVSAPAASDLRESIQSATAVLIDRGSGDASGLLHKARGRVALAIRAAAELRVSDALTTDAQRERLEQLTSLLRAAAASLAEQRPDRRSAQRGTLRESLGQVGARYVSLVDLHFDLAPDPLLDELASNRFIQTFVDEAVANAWRHGGRRVRLSAVVEGAEVRIAVVDDGAGFDPESVVRGEGLQVLDDCAQCMGGRLEVRRNPTTVRLSFPVDEAG